MADFTDLLDPSGILDEDTLSSIGNTAETARPILGVSPTGSRFIENFDTRGAYAALREKGDEDLEAKRKIAERLAQETRFSIEAATRAGYSYDEIISKLTGVDREEYGGGYGAAARGFGREIAPTLALGAGGVYGGRGAGKVMRGAAGAASAAGQKLRETARDPSPPRQVDPRVRATGGQKPNLAARILNLTPKVAKAAAAARLGPISKGLGYLTGVFGGAIGAEVAARKGVDEVFGEARPLELADYPRYEAGRTAGMFIGSIPATFSIANVLKDIPNLAPAAIGTNVARMGAKEGGDPSGFVRKMFDWGRQQAGEKAARARARAAGGTRAAQEALEGGAGALKKVGQAIVEHPKSVIAGEAALGLAWTPFGAMVAEELYPAQAGAKLGAEITASVVYPGSMLSLVKIPFRKASAAFGKGAREQQAADYMVNLFDELQKRGVEETPEEFLATLRAAKFEDVSGNVVEVTPSQLTGSTTYSILEKFLSDVSPAYSAVNKKSARDGHAALTGLITALYSHSDPNLVNMAAKLEEKMLQDTFTKWFDVRLDKAVATTEAFAKRTDATPATIQREVNNQVHESMKSALTDARVVEKRLYQDVDKTMEVSVDNIAKRWNDEYAKLFKPGVTRKELERAGIPAFLKELENPDSQLWGQLTEQLQNSQKLSDDLNKAVEKSAGQSASLALNKYLRSRAMGTGLTPDQKLVAAERAFRNTPERGGAPGTYETIEGVAKDLTPKQRKNAADLAKKMQDIRKTDAEINGLTAEITKISNPDGTAPEHFKRVTLRELMGFRSEMLNSIRSTQAGEVVNYNARRIYGELADAALDDMGANINKNPISGEVIDEAQEVSPNVKKLIKAYTFSRALNDSFSRGFGGTLGHVKGTGQYKVQPELALEELFKGSSNAVSIKYTELQEALSLLETASKGINETAEGLFVPNIVSLIEDEGLRKAGVNDALDMFLRQAFRDEAVVRTPVYNPATGETIDRAIVDEKKWGKFLKDHEEILSLDILSTLRKDLTDLPQRDQLVSAYYNNHPDFPDSVDFALKGPGETPTSVGDFWANMQKEAVWAKLLGNENPTKVVANIFRKDNKNFSPQYKELVRLAKGHPNTEAREAFRDSIIKYAFEEARTPDGYSLKKIHKVLFEPEYNGHKMPPLLEALADDEIVGTTFNQKLDDIITQMAKLERLADQGEDVSKILENDSPLFVFAARVIGAAAGRTAAAKTGMGGTVQIPGAAATFAKAYLNDMPSVLIQDILIKASTPGKDGAKLLEALLKKGRTEQEKTAAAETIGSAIAFSLGAPVSAITRRPVLGYEVFRAEDVEQPFPEDAPTPQSRGPLAPVREYIPRVGRALIPGRAPAASAPAPTPPPTAPAPQPTAQGTTQENRQRFAQMFPGDITSGLINQGIGSYRP
jgi:hypothetical protein